jgi:lysophospholipase L1-like esterase
MYTKLGRAVFILAGIVYALWSYVRLANLSLGIADFYTTFFIYFSTVLLCLVIFVWLPYSRNVVLSLIAGLVALFACEAAMRFVVKQNLTYTEKNGKGYNSAYPPKGMLREFIVYKDVIPNTSADFNYPASKPNALGLSGALPARNKKVVLFLGDSFTQGFGAPADSSYPVLLGNLIAARDTGTAILNAGVNGSDIFYGWRFAQKQVFNRYHVSHLILTINPTDINDVITRGGDERFQGLQPSGPWWEPLYAASFVFRVFLHKIVNVNYLLLTPPQHAAAQKAALQKITVKLKEIAAWAKAHGIKLILVAHPELVQFQMPVDDYSKLMGAIKNAGIENIVDCHDAVAEQNSKELIYWTTDQHFRPKGYLLLARQVYGSCFEGPVPAAP